MLYDVASTVMYLGGRQRSAAFLRAYESHGGLRTSELTHLDAFRRLREAVQAVYFAGRLTTADLTGGVAQADNEKGRDDARRRLTALGLDPA